MDKLTIDYVNNELVAENPPPEEKCPICYEPFDMEQIFSLPECGHTFHTNCIYHWARLGNNNCPYCNNTGQTNDTNSENSNQYEGFYYYNSEILTEKLSIIRKFSKKKKAPKSLKTKFVKLKKKNKELRELNIEIKNLKQKVGIFNELQKEYRNLKNKHKTKKRQIYNIKRKICSINIKPIIIVKRIAI